jgi:hypothetical protein
VCPTPGTAPRALDFREEPDFSPACRVAARSCAIFVLATRCWATTSQMSFALTASQANRC